MKVYEDEKTNTIEYVCTKCKEIVLKETEITDLEINISTKTSVTYYSTVDDNYTELSIDSMLNCSKCKCEKSVEIKIY